MFPQNQDLTLVNKLENMSFTLPVNRLIIDICSGSLDKVLTSSCMYTIESPLSDCDMLCALASDYIFWILSSIFFTSNSFLWISSPVLMLFILCSIFETSDCFYSITLFRLEAVDTLDEASAVAFCLGGETIFVDGLASATKVWFLSYYLTTGAGCAYTTATDGVAFFTWGSGLYWVTNGDTCCLMKDEFLAAGAWTCLVVSCVSFLAKVLFETFYGSLLTTTGAFEVETGVDTLEVKTALLIFGVCAATGFGGIITWL